MIVFVNRHDVVEVAGLIGMSFGQDDVDRYTIVYKKDYAPSEDEVLARRNGELWNEQKAIEYAQKVSLVIMHVNWVSQSKARPYNLLASFRKYGRPKREDAKQLEVDRSIKSDVVVPSTNYKDKYVHLIGQEAALDAARKTESNKSYGFGESSKHITKTTKYATSFDCRHQWQMPATNLLL